MTMTTATTSNVEPCLGAIRTSLEHSLPYQTQNGHTSNTEEGDHSIEEASHLMEGILPDQDHVNGDTNIEKKVAFSDFPGISDDEGREEAFDRTFPGPKSSKRKQSPHQSDEEQADMNSMSKKLRNALCGDLNGSFDDNNDDVGEEDDRADLSGRGYSPTYSSSARPSPALSEENPIIPPDDRAPYEFRKNISRDVQPTWIDADNSGNYDPAEEARKNAVKLAKARAAKREKTKEKEKEKEREKAKEKDKKRKRTEKEKEKERGKRHKQKSPRKEGTMKCIVRLRFSKPIFENVQNILGEDEGTWPDNWSDVDSDAEREKAEYRAFYRHNPPASKKAPQIPILDPAGEYEDITGMPIARGCEDCRKHKQYCSMISNGGWPCEQCVEDGISCRPIIPPPAIPIRCQRCNEEGEENCSFENGLSEGHEGACDECLISDEPGRCIKPSVENFAHKRNRIDLDQILYGPTREYITCTSCRKYGLRCNLKKKEDKPPCKQCKRNKKEIGCTFYDEEWAKPDPSKQSSKRKESPPQSTNGVSKPDSSLFTQYDLEDLDNEDSQEVPREPTPEIEMDDSNGHKGVVTCIKTSFAHPMTFQVEDPESDSDPVDCNFCSMPVFGMVGHFERDVHVIRWYDGLGFTEIGGGWCEEKGATKMCQRCTVSRLQIIHCDEHQIEPIPDAPTDEDFEVAFDNLCAQTEELDIHLQLQHWCSLCFSLASFKCAHPTESLFNDNDDETDGCGLKLCGMCEEKLRGPFGGDCQALVTAMEAERKVKDGEDGDLEKEKYARADVGLLRQEGLLSRNAQLQICDAEGADYR